MGAEMVARLPGLESRVASNDSRPQKLTWDQEFAFFKEIPPDLIALL